MVISAYAGGSPAGEFAVSMWSGATHWFGGEGSLEQAHLVSGLGDRPALVMDRKVSDTVFGRRAAKFFHYAGGGNTALLVDRSPTAADVLAFHQTLTRVRPTGVVAVGGGSTIDLAMLAALDCAPALVRASVRMRSGLLALQSSDTARWPTLAVPTTLGPGAEVSSAACFDGAGGKHLVTGPPLRPAAAAVEPSASASLPNISLSASLIEIFARIVVPFCREPVGDPVVTQMADEVALAGLRQLGRSRTGAELRSVESRMRLAIVGAHSHVGWGQVGRHRFASPIWFIATELSQVTGWSKAVSTATLLPAWSQLVMQGRACWGASDRLILAWTSFTGTRATDDVVRGIGGLSAPLHHVTVGGVPEDLAALVTSRALRRWGSGQNLAGGVEQKDMEYLISSSLVAGPLEAE